MSNRKTEYESTCPVCFVQLSTNEKLADHFFKKHIDTVRTGSNSFGQKVEIKQCFCGHLLRGATSWKSHIKKFNGLKYHFYMHTLNVKDTG